MAGRCILRRLAVVSVVALAAMPELRAAAPDGFRELAPGVLTVIPPDVSTDDTIQRGDILEITRGLADTAWTPKRDSIGGTLVERAKDRIYPRDVWCLEFAYKPPRHIDIDLPGSDLTMRRKRVLYMLYRVKNTGGRRSTAPAADPAAFARETYEEPVRFLPHFVLESVEGLTHPEGSIHYRGYLDRVTPEAIEPIRRREGVAPSRGLYPLPRVSRPCDSRGDRADPTPGRRGRPSARQREHGGGEARAGRGTVGRGRVDRHRSADRFLLDLRPRSHQCRALAE